MSNVMIISTQTPMITPRAPGQAPPGQTGQMIQKLTDGGFVHMHRDKQIKGSKEQKEFDQHLKSGGWLVITGHGDEGTQILSGGYASEEMIRREQMRGELPIETIDIYVSAKEYVDLIVKSNTLKSGDHINVLLYVCLGAKSLGNQKSFAIQLAEEFAARGISSHIVGSVNIVGRLKGYGVNDKKDELLKFRANKNDIRIIEAGPNHPITETSPQRDIFITKYGVVESDVNFENYKKMLGELSKHLSLDNFFKDRAQAESTLKNENVGFILRQDINGHLKLSYKENEDFVHIAIATPKGLNVKLQSISNKIDQLAKNISKTQTRSKLGSTASVMSNLPNSVPNERLPQRTNTFEEHYENFKTKFPQLAKHVSPFDDFIKDRILAEKALDSGATYIIRYSTQNGFVASIKDNGVFCHIKIRESNANDVLNKINELKTANTRNIPAATIPTPQPGTTVETVSEKNNERVHHKPSKG